MADDTETGALLTPTQRKYLRGKRKDDLSEAGERMTKKRIRDRIRQGLVDFATIVKHLDDEEFSRVFAGDIDGPDPETYLPHLVAFAFRHHEGVHTEGASLVELEPVVAEGVEIGAEVMGWSSSAVAQISFTKLERIDERIGEIKDRLESRGVDAISFDELEELLEADELTREEFNELYVEKAERLREQAKKQVDEAEERLDEEGYMGFGFLGDDEAAFIFEELERRGHLGGGEEESNEDE